MNNQPEYDEVDVANLLQAALDAINEVYNIIARYGVGRTV
jgi:hypothetical protein